MDRVVANANNIRVTGVELYLLPVSTRVPLKFGTETLTTVTCDDCGAMDVVDEASTALDIAA